jgi:hypothetical protein
MIFLVAGYDTTGLTLSYAAYHLAKNPGVQARLQADIDAAVADSDGDLPDYTVIQSGLPYLEVNSCCYITVDSATTALQNGACTCRCISKKCTVKHPFAQRLHEKSEILYKLHHSVLSGKFFFRKLY